MGPAYVVEGIGNVRYNIWGERGYRGGTCAGRSFGPVFLAYGRPGGRTNRARGKGPATG